MKKHLADLRKNLLEIVRTTTNGGSKNKAQLQQSLSIEPEDIDALKSQGGGDVIIVQSGVQVQSTHIINLGVEALESLYNVEDCLRAMPVVNYEEALDDLVELGYKLDTIEQMTRKRVTDKVKSSAKNKSAAAKQLGIKRTTYLNREQRDE